MIIAAAIFVMTFVFSLALTRLTRDFALRVGFTDKPDKERKLHKHATALGGGVAIYLATVVALLVLLATPNDWQAELLGAWLELTAFLVAGAVIVVVGLLDDRFKLRGRQKLAGQVLAALVLVLCGLTIKRFEIFGWHVELGMLSGVVTIIWLIGAINAINLLDGIDGLASTIGLILTGAIAAMAALYGNWPVSIVAMMFAAATLGFLRYNFPPATIFLGDTGSMLIGLVVGTLAIQGSLKGAGTVLLAAPLAFWTIPFFDSAAAILRRRLTGRSIYDTDRAHLHHCLMRRFGSNRKVVGWVAGGCCFTAVAALVSVVLHSDIIALLGCVAVIAMLVATRLFGHVELALVFARLKDMSHSLLRWPFGKAALARHNTVRLQGHRRWELLWESLTEEAEKLGLLRVRLILNLALLEEGFYATWQRSADGGNAQRWTVELPLFARGQSVGRLHLVGQSGSAGAFEDLDLILAVLAPLEDMLSELAEDAHGRPAPKALPVPQPVALSTPSADESPVSFESHPREPVVLRDAFSEFVTRESGE